MCIRDRIYDIRRGVLVLIPEGTIHRKINPSNVTVDTYTLHYPLALLEAYSTPHTDLTQLYGTQAMCIQLPAKDLSLIHICGRKRRSGCPYQCRR